MTGKRAAGRVPSWGENADDRPGPRAARRPEKSGGDLRHRAARYGLYRSLHLSDPALRPVARDERRRDWRAGERAARARPPFVDPYRRADGPVRHAPGHAVFRVDRDRAGAGVPAGALVLGPAAA